MHQGTWSATATSNRSVAWVRSSCVKGSTCCRLSVPSWICCPTSRRGCSTFPGPLRRRSRPCSRPACAWRGRPLSIAPRSCASTTAATCPQRSPCPDPGSQRRHLDCAPVTDQTPDLPPQNQADTPSVEPHLRPHFDPHLDQRSRDRRTSTLLALLVVAILGGGGLFVSGFTLGRLAGATPGTTDANQDLFRPFWDAYNDVSTNYVGATDPRVLIEGAIKGIFQALDDPFSAYLTEEEYRASLGGISGEFEGVGVEMTTRDGAGEPCDTISQTCRMVITRVIRGSPALDAGLQVDDFVLAVDGVATDGSTLDVVVPTIRGPKGTVVTLPIERAGQTMDVPVTRDVIQREDVRSELLAGGSVGYLKVDGFSAASAQDLHDMLGTLIETNHVEALILDLRNDPGGHLSAALSIASVFSA